MKRKVNSSGVGLNMAGVGVGGGQIRISLNSGTPVVLELG